MTFGIVNLRGLCLREKSEKKGKLIHDVCRVKHWSEAGVKDETSELKGRIEVVIRR